MFIAPSSVTSAANFGAVCAAIGQRARCCVIPIVSSSPTPSKSSVTFTNKMLLQLGQAVLCTGPSN